MTSYRKFCSISPHSYTLCCSPPHRQSLLPTYNTSKKLADVPNMGQQQFQEVTWLDEKELMFFKHRSQLRKRGTPKVIILCGDTGRPKVFVQKLRNTLSETLLNIGARQRILILLEVFDLLCYLVKEHGFFYFEKYMVKVNKKGQPVVWINQHFSANHREFAIKDSDVAQIIFIKKLKMTFSYLSVFTIPSTIKTILEMRHYLQGLLYGDSKQNCNSQQFTLQTCSNPNAFMKTKLNSRNFQNFPINKNCWSNLDYGRGCQVMKSKSPQKFKKLPQYTPIFKSPQKAPFRYQKNKQSKLKIQGNCSMPAFLVIQKKESCKSRKCSADINTLAQWLKASSKRIQRPFGNSTFSTNSTFKYHQQFDERKEEENTEQNYQQNPQSRNKVQFGIKKMYEEQTLKIEQDPLQMQMENLLDSVSTKKKKSLKESEINRQLNELFESDIYSTSICPSHCFEDFQALLTN